MYTDSGQQGALRLAIASAVLFGLGALAQISADIWLAHTRTVADIAEWSLFRSIAFTGGVLALLGAERQIFRMTAGAAAFFRRALSLAFLLAVVFSLAARQMFPVDSSSPLLVLGIFGASAVLLTVEYNRGQLRLVAAQWAYSGWKLLFLLLCVLGVDLVIGGAGVPVSFLLAIALSFGVLPMLGRFRNQGAPPGDEGVFPPGEGEGRRLRLMFFLLSVDFVLTLYLDQLLLGAFLEKVLLATYFAHLSLMMSPFLLITSLLTFLYGAWVRSLASREAGRGLLPAAGVAGLLALLTAAFMLMAGPALFQILYAERYPFTIGVAFGLCAAGALRVFSAVPGSMLAVVADSREMTLLVAGNTTGLFFHVALFIGLLAGGYTDGLHATVAALLANWTIRVLTASAISLMALRRLRRLRRPVPAVAGA